MALIVTKNNVEIPIQELTNLMTLYIKSGKISKFAMPDRYKFLNSLPKTSVGKMDKKEMRRIFI